VAVRVISEVVVLDIVGSLEKAGMTGVNTVPVIVCEASIAGSKVFKYAS
jgi:hypothetical protein